MTERDWQVQKKKALAASRERSSPLSGPASIFAAAEQAFHSWSTDHAQLPAFRDAESYFATLAVAHWTLHRTAEPAPSEQANAPARGTSVAVFPQPQPIASQTQLTSVLRLIFLNLQQTPEFRRRLEMSRIVGIPDLRP